MTGNESSSTRSGFFSTAPGVLTAVAAVITALGGIYGVYVSQNHAAVADPPVVVTSASTPADDQESPEADVPADEIGTDAISGIAVLHDATVQESDVGTDPLGTWYAGTDLDSQATADGCALGDVDACTALEAILVVDCEATWDAACDVLYLAEPEGSELENLGATCGYLFEDWTYAGECTS